MRPTVGDRKGWHIRVAVAGAVMGLLALGDGDASAQRVGAVLVADIRPGPAGSYPFGLTNVAGTLMFGAADGRAGFEPWKAERSRASMVKDIRPGPPSSLLHSFFPYKDYKMGADPGGCDPTCASYYTVVGDTVFVPAGDGSSGQELWKSEPPYDATSTGMVEDINPGPGSSLGFYFESWGVGDVLFFVADDGSSGGELWKSEPPYDATSTTIVEDINSGPVGSTLFIWRTNVGSTLFFFADDGISGLELWKSEPPYDAASTTQVADINPGPQGGVLYEILEFNGTVFLKGDDGISGAELWKSEPPYDATSTTMVEDINPGPAGSSPNGPRNVGGTLLFSANDGTTGDELWKSDGTEPGTTMVEDINPGAAGSLDLDSWSSYENDDGTLFFTANDGFIGEEPWKSESPYTAASTSLVWDVNSGPASASPSWYQQVGATLFFSANDGDSGQELWAVADH